MFEKIKIENELKKYRNKLEKEIEKAYSNFEFDMNLRILSEKQRRKFLPVVNGETYRKFRFLCLQDSWQKDKRTTGFYTMTEVITTQLDAIHSMIYYISENEYKDLIFPLRVLKRQDYGVMERMHMIMNLMYHDLMPKGTALRASFELIGILVDIANKVYEYYCDEMLHKPIDNCFDLVEGTHLGAKTYHQLLNATESDEAWVYLRMFCANVTMKTLSMGVNQFYQLYDIIVDYYLTVDKIMGTDREQYVRQTFSFYTEKKCKK